MMSQFFIILLMLDAAVVFVLQILRINPYLLVCGYWLILTVKNFIDLVQKRKENR